MTKDYQAHFYAGPVTITVASWVAGGRWHGPSIDIAVAKADSISVATCEKLSTAAADAVREAYKQADQNSAKNQQIVLARGKVVG